ncbi:MAG: hypothetical protein ABJP70_08660 [Erythrobacter sp.]
MAHLTRMGAALGLAAAASMASTPAFAADTPEGLIAPQERSALFADFDSSTYDAESDVSEWRYRNRRYRRGRVRAGDVLAGVLIIGGIAAVASAASKNNKRRDRDYDTRDDRDYDTRDDRRDDRRETRRNANGLEGAVDQCVSRIERDVRVDEVGSVNRTADGWLVTGTLFNGSGFSCSIGTDGQISDVQYGSFGAAASDAGSRASVDAQWDDSSYLAAQRARGGAAEYRGTANGTPPLASAGSNQLPAYPGGPLPGEQFPE